MTKRLPSLEYYQSLGKWHWCVKDVDGSLISESFDGYKTKREAEKSVDLTFCAIREYREEKA